MSADPECRLCGRLDIEESDHVQLCTKCRSPESWMPCSACGMVSVGSQMTYSMRIKGHLCLRCTHIRNQPHTIALPVWWPKDLP